MPQLKRPNSSSCGLMPLVQFLLENGGLATAKSKVFNWPLASFHCGDARVLPFQILAVALLCRIMFIRASALVALSISWPKIDRPRGASSLAFNNSEPEPQVGSYTVASCDVSLVMPTTLARMRDTSAGV